MKMNMKVTLFFVVALFVFAHSASAQSTRLYVGNLPIDMDDLKLREMFEHFGDIRDVHVVMDKDTGKSRGFGYVTMGSYKEAGLARQKMNGSQAFSNKLLIVTFDDPSPRDRDSKPFGGGNQIPAAKPADKPNEPQTTPKTEPKQTEPPKETDEPEDEVKTMTLYVGNLSSETTEDSLQEAFEEVGEVISVEIEKDEKGKPTGVAYIEMSAEDAENAISALHGSELNGKKIVVKKAEQPEEN